MKKGLEKTEPVYGRGDRVEVRWEALTPRPGTVVSVKWSPESGWRVDVVLDESEEWWIVGEDVLEKIEAEEEAVAS